ncbi:MAG: ABC transporter transmembrane domain-containing protein, partial [Pseudomonadota bacterium]
MVAGCLVNVIALGVPLTIMLIYDRVIGVGNPAALPMLAVGLALTLGFEWWMRTIRSSTLSWFSGRLDFVVGTKIFERLLDLPPEKTQKASVSAQVARVKTFESVRDFFASAPFIGMLDMPFVVIGLAAIFIIAGPLAFVPLCAIAVYAALFLAMRGRIKPAVHIAARTSSARQQFAIDALEKLIDIRSLGLVDKWSDKYRHLMGRETMAQLHLKWLSTITETLAQTVTTLAAVATVGFGVLLVWSGSVSAGALVASILIVWRILGPFYWLSITVARSEQLRNSNLQIDELMELEGETEYSRRLATMPRVLGRVSFQDVAVRPADAVSDAFRGLSFHAEPGDAVALVGADGIDKGLVLKLLHSLQRPSAGVVQLDGFDLRQLNPRAVRRQVAYVPQRPEFLGWSVAENLRLVHAFATDEALWDALELADASEDVRAMPDGIDTILDGSFSPGLDPDLSARLGLARGYLQPGNVLLVDDLPNSVLTGQAGANFKAYIA